MVELVNPRIPEREELFVLNELIVVYFAGERYDACYKRKNEKI